MSNVRWQVALQGMMGVGSRMLFVTAYHTIEMQSLQYKTNLYQLVHPDERLQI